MFCESDLAILVAFVLVRRWEIPLFVWYRGLASWDVGLYGWVLGEFASCGNWSMKQQKRTWMGFFVKLVARERFKLPLSLSWLPPLGCDVITWDARPRCTMKTEFWNLSVGRSVCLIPPRICSHQLAGGTPPPLSPESGDLLGCGLT